MDDAPLRPVLDMVGWMPRVALSAEAVTVVRNGGRLSSERFGVGDDEVKQGPWALVTAEDELIAVHELVDGVVKAGVVIPE